MHCIKKAMSFRFEHSFEPKLLYISDCWITGIICDPTGTLRVEEVTRPEITHPMPIDQAMEILERAWDGMHDEVHNNTIPIFCLHDLDPHSEGVKSFLYAPIPIGIENQIKAIGLSRPLDMRTIAGRGKSGVIGKTVVDFRSDRIIVIGNARNLCYRFKILGERLRFPCDKPHRVLDELLDKIKLQSSDTLGTSLLIGGFGTVFGFEAALMFTKLQKLSSDEYEGHIIACILSFLSILFFCMFEAFEGRIVAFSSWWTTRSKLISWFIFLMGLLTAPAVAFAPINPLLVCNAIRLIGILLVLSCAVTNLGQVFFEEGLTKRSTLIWWLAMALFMLFTPMMDYIPSGQFGKK